MDIIPTGFRFCPSDKVLLSYYLLKKLKRESTQFQIPDVDVYGIEPWSLFNDINDDDEDDNDDDDDEAMYNNNLTYVFATIKKKDGNNESNRKKKKQYGNGSERISRTVTTPSSKNQVIGTWKDQKAHDIIDNASKKIIGAKRMLSFVPAPSKQDHDDEDTEGTSNKRKRNHQLDGISYIMHEYSMAGSSHVLCRIRRKISKSRKMNNKKMKYSSSCSENITRKNTCWDDQAGAEYDQPLHGSRMPYEDDHHQMMTNTSVLLNHNQSSMLQKQQDQAGAEYDQPLHGSGMPYEDDLHQMMTNTSVLLNHNQSSMLQQQQDQDAEYNQQVQECMPQMMMTASVLDHDQNSMWQQQQLDQDTELNYQIQECIPQVMMDTSIVDHEQSSMRQQPDQDTELNYQIQECIPQVMMDTSISIVDHEQSSMRQQPDQDAGFVPLLEEVLLLDNTTTTTSTSTSNADEDKTTGTGHEEVEQEEDLSNQQQQPPAPTSEREDNLYLISSIDFQSDDFWDLGNLDLPERFESFDEPLDTISLWSY